MGREQFTRDGELHYGGALSDSKPDYVLILLAQRMLIIYDMRLQGLRVAKDSACNCVD